MAIKDIYDKACEAINTGADDYAIELFRQLLRLEPEYPNARGLLRRAERRRVGKAGGLLDALVRQAKGLWPALRAKILTSDPQDKLDRWEDYLELNPNSILGLRGAGVAAWKAGMFDTAILLLGDVILLRPKHKRTMRALAQVFEDSGRANEASNVLRALAAQQPYDQDLESKIKNLAALDHMQSTGMEKAGSFRDLIRDKDFAGEAVRRLKTEPERRATLIEEARQELARDPDNVSRIAGLALLYRQESQPQEGLRLLEEARERLPDNYEIRALTGDMRLEILKSEIDAIDGQLQKNPGNQELLKKKRDVQSQRADLAAQEFAWRVEEHPTDHGLHLKLGQALFDKNDYDGAIAAFQFAVRSAALGVQAALMLGRCFAAKEQYDLAVEQYSKAVAARPQLDQAGMELHYLLASALELMGDRQEALKVYKKIYSTDIHFRDVAKKVDALSG